MQCKCWHQQRLTTLSHTCSILNQLWKSWISYLVSCTTHVALYLPCYFWSALFKSLQVWVWSFLSSFAQSADQIVISKRKNASHYEQCKRILSSSSFVFLFIGFSAGAIAGNWRLKKRVEGGDAQTCCLDIPTIISGFSSNNTNQI